MSIYIIKHYNGKYEAPLGSENSYTNNLKNAARFATRGAAENNLCRDSEYITTLQEELNQ